MARIDLEEGAPPPDEEEDPGPYHPWYNPDGRRSGTGVAATTGEGTQPQVEDTGGGNWGLSSQIDASERSTESLIQQIIDLAKKTDEKNREAIEQFIGTSIPKLEALAAAATVGDAGAMAQLKEVYANFEELAPPEMVEAAKSNAVDLERQQEAYGRQVEAADAYKPLMTEGLTAQERYEMELARLEEEGSRKAILEATLRDLDARGARSGGAEMTALLGSQQTTSQNRALQDLGSLANAQQRRLGAIEGYAGASNMAAGTAGQMRDAGDIMNRFNQQQAQQWSQWESDFKASQQRDAADRAKNMFDAGTYVNNQAYNRGHDVYSAERDATAMKTGQYSQGAANLQDAISKGIGVREARRAEAALEDDGSFNLFKPDTWF